jgi:hypothetical protein
MALDTIGVAEAMEVDATRAEHGVPTICCRNQLRLQGLQTRSGPRDVMGEPRWELEIVSPTGLLDAAWCSRFFFIDLPQGLKS